MTATLETTAPGLETAWRLNPSVAVRREAFGAMTYHFGSRRLSFLKSRRLARVVETLGDHPTALAACQVAGVADGEMPAYAEALGRLADAGIVVRDPFLSRTESAEATAAPVDPSSTTPVRPARGSTSLADRFQEGLAAPICITWELTYACNLACVHCLSSSGRRDPRELSTAECRAVIDELERLQVFYVNIGGGEPTVRRDFWDLLDYASDHHVGVKFSTNGTRITPGVAQRLAGSDYVDVQISLDGATAAVNDAVRGEGSYEAARRAMANLAEAGFENFKVSVVATRDNLHQLDELLSLADDHGAQLRITRLRPSGRGAEVWDDLHPTAEQQRGLYHWLLDRGERVLTGDSFFHLAGYGAPLPGLNFCGAGRVVCLIDPVGDVYACPFTIHEDFRAGNVRSPGGFAEVWRAAALFERLRGANPEGPCTTCSAFDGCRGGCMAAKYFTGLPLDGPDPECVKGHGAAALSARGAPSPPRPSVDHSKTTRRVPVELGRAKGRPCNSSPLDPVGAVC
jgi:mycofactocin radical SAM maturase